jgi:hypothetical protein
MPIINPHPVHSGRSTEAVVVTLSSLLRIKLWSTSHGEVVSRSRSTPLLRPPRRGGERDAVQSRRAERLERAGPLRRALQRVGVEDELPHRRPAL